MLSLIVASQRRSWGSRATCMLPVSSLWWQEARAILDLGARHWHPLEQACYALWQHGVLGVSGESSASHARSAGMSDETTQIASVLDYIGRSEERRVGKE